MSLKYTTEEMKELFKEQGCELLDEYHGTHSPMDYKCKCGKYSTTTWNNFSKGKRCGHCAKTGRVFKYSLREVRKMFEERGFELLEDEYKNNKCPMRYRCKCGRESKICLVALKYQNQSCFECGIEKLKGANNPAWRDDRDKLKLEQKFRKRCYKALSSSLKAVGKDKVGRTSDMLGYGPKELQEHITQHPNWEKVKDGNWHIDHIWPIKAFVDHGVDDISLINRLDNLRPISQRENNQKHANYDKEKFEKWIKSVPNVDIDHCFKKE